MLRVEPQLRMVESAPEISNIMHVSAVARGTRHEEFVFVEPAV